jgi:hypothetical protein
MRHPQTYEIMNELRDCIHWFFSDIFKIQIVVIAIASYQRIYEIMNEFCDFPLANEFC